MITFRLPECRSASTLITLLLTLQITACGTENLATAITPDIGTNTTTDITSGNNRAAIISGIDTGSVIEDVDPDGDNFLEVSGKLSITDSDAGEAAFLTTTSSGNYGNLDIDANGNWQYAADNNQNGIQNLAANETLTDSLIVSSIDGTTHTINITIIGVTDNIPGAGGTPNTPATISGASTGSVTEDVDPNNNNLLEVSGKLNISDPDAGEASFIATTFNGIYGGLIIDAAGNWTYAAVNSLAAIQNLNSGATLTDSLTISSVDGTTHTMTFTIIGADENVALSNIALTWTAPAVREDNSALSLAAIAGYKIYYGTTQGQYSSNTTINDGSATGYTFNNFASATYYFVVTTIDTDGRESQYSPEMTISI